MAGLREHRVRVLFEGVNKLKGVLEDINRKMSVQQGVIRNTQKRIADYRNDLDKQAIGEMRLGKRAIKNRKDKIKANQIDLRDQQAMLSTMRAHAQLVRNKLTTDQRVANNMRENVREHSRFKMHLLSVMFFGMAVQRVFAGYIKQVADMTGITSMLTVAFQMLLLPVLLPLTHVFEKLLDWVLKLSPSTKRLLGSMILTTFILGSLLMIVGMLGLGFQGLKQFIDNLIPAEALTNLSVLGVSLGELPTAIEDLLITGGLLVGGGGLFAMLSSAIYGATSALDKSGKEVDKGGGFFDKLKDNAITAIDKIVERANFVLPTKIALMLKIVWKTIKAFFASEDKVEFLNETFNTMLGRIEWTSKENYIKSHISSIIHAVGWDEHGEFIGNQLINGMMDALSDRIGGAIGERVSGSIGGASRGGLFGPAGALVGGVVGAFSPNIVVNANVSSDVDIDHLADRISSRWNDDLRRLILR